MVQGVADLVDDAHEGGLGADVDYGLFLAEGWAATVEDAASVDGAFLDLGVC